MILLQRGEARSAIRGILHLMRFDATGISFFDDSVAGCVRSFWAAASSVAVFYLALLLDGSPATGSHNWLADLVIKSTGFVILCLIFPLGSERILHWAGRDASWPLLVSCYNWLHCVRNWMWLGLVLLTHATALTTNVGWPLFVTFIIFFLIVEGFVFSTVLRGHILLAVLLVFVDLFFVQTVNAVARGLA